MASNPFVSALQYVPRIRTHLQLGAFFFVVVAIGASLWTKQANLLLVLAMLLGGAMIIIIAGIPWLQLLEGVPGRIKGLIAILVVLFGGFCFLVITVGLVVVLVRGVPTLNREETRYIERAKQLFNENRETDALVELKKVSKNNYDGLMLKGRIYLVLGTTTPSYYKQAEELLDDASKMNPQDGAAWHNRGFARFKLGKWELARDDFLKAISLGTDQLATRYMLGLSYYELGKLSQAEAEWKGLSQRADLTTREKSYAAKAHLGLAYVFAAKDDSKAALEQIKRSLEESLAAKDKEDTELIRRTICRDLDNPAEPLSRVGKGEVFGILTQQLERAC